VSTVNDLTPQELRIALSLAVGRMAREIAAALFLSPQIFEYRLRSVYRKPPRRIAGRATGLTGLQQLGQQGRGARGAVGFRWPVIDRPRWPRPARSRRCAPRNWSGSHHAT
jgi:hypothetical protein